MDFKCLDHRLHAKDVPLMLSISFFLTDPGGASLSVIEISVSSWKSVPLFTIRVFPLSVAASASDWLRSYPPHDPKPFEIQ